MIDLSKYTTADALRFWLDKGTRRKAAEWAREKAATAKVDELREIVAVLADAIELAGDKRPQTKRRGARTKDLAKVTGGDLAYMTLADERARIAKRRQMDRAVAIYEKQVEAIATIRDRTATLAQQRAAHGVLVQIQRQDVTQRAIAIDPGDRKRETLARARAARIAGVDVKKLAALLNSTK